MKGIDWQRIVEIALKKKIQRALIGLSLFLVLFGLIGYFTLPSIIRSQTEKLIADKLHRPVTLERITVNPYTLTVTVQKFKLMEPDGNTVFASFDELKVNSSIQSLFRLAPVIEELKLINPYFRVARNGDGRYNIDDIIAPPAVPAPTPSDTTLRLLVDKISIEGGSFAYDDAFSSRPINALIEKFDLAVNDVSVDLGKREASVAEVLSNSAQFTVKHHKGGASQPKAAVASARAASTPDKNDTPPFVAVIEKIAIANWRAQIEDHHPKKSAVTTVSNLSLDVQHLSTKPGEKGTLALKAAVNDTGSIAVNGTLAPTPLQAHLALDIKAADITALQPYFTEQVNLFITSAQLSANGSLALAQETSGAMGGAFTGNLLLGNVATVDKFNVDDFLRWQSLAINGVQAHLRPFSLAIDHIALDDFYARIIVNRKGRINLQDIVRSGKDKRLTDASETDDAKETQAATNTKTSRHLPGKTVTAPSPPITIGSVTLSNGKVLFTDNYITPHYTANLLGLGGTIAGLSSDAKSTASVALRGMVNSAPLQIRGKVNPLKDELFLDLKASVKGMELAPLSPYADKYAGYGIQKGQLSFAVSYKLDRRQLSAENRLVLDQLTFGEKVDSPSATTLPVTLAVALLRDRNGVIDINLPIRGSLDDPEFSVGGVIVQVVVNLLTKAATAPFSLLASALGGGEELSWIAFDAGQATILKQNEAKLTALAKALNDRPALKLEITGIVDPDSDSQGLVKAGLQRKRLLLLKAKITNDDLIALGNRRAQATKEWLVTKGGVPTERIFILASKVAAKDDSKPKSSRVDFSLK